MRLKLTPKDTNSKKTLKSQMNHKKKNNLLNKQKLLKRKYFKTLYISQYINYIKLKNSYLLFNGINGFIDEVSIKAAEYLKSKIKINIEDGILSESDIDYFYQRGYLTELNPEKEKKFFKLYIKMIDKVRQNHYKNNGNLMFALSYKCNLNCFYCYQKEVRKNYIDSYMDENFINNFFKNIFPVLYKNLNYRNIAFTLYGGEPFLKRNKNSIKAILKFAEKHRNHVGAISNCVEVDEFLEYFGPIPGKINFVQISFDGIPVKDDIAQSYRKKISIFKKILSNTHKLIDRKVKINIRINITKDEIKNIDQLYELFEKEEILENPFVYVYIHPVHNHFNQTDQSILIDITSLKEKMKNLNIKNIDKINEPIKRKAEMLKYLFFIQEGIALSKTRFCMQNLPNNYLIDCYRNIYGCYEQAGRVKYRIGFFDNERVFFNKRFRLYQKRVIHRMDKCLECSVALICGGECSLLSEEKNGSAFEPYCENSKTLILNALKYCYEKQIKANERINFFIDFPNL